MFLHLGENISVPAKEIIGIFDLETTTVTGETRKFLNAASDEGMVVSVNNEMPKAFVVINNKRKNSIYLSPISVATLKQRIVFPGKYYSNSRNLYNSDNYFEGED